MPSAPDTCPEPGATRPEAVDAHATTWAVVLAGGASRRFGSDKLAARLGPDSLLERAVRGLPPDTRLVIVGPARPGLRTDRPTAYVREDPPGGGPAAAMVAGLLAATAAARPNDLVLVLPGDAPAAGPAAARLRAALVDDDASDAVVAIGPDGREQPLQLALRTAAADRLIEAAGQSRGAGWSARVLVSALDDTLRGLQLDPELTADIDTADDLDRWRNTQR